MGKRLDVDMRLMMLSDGVDDASWNAMMKLMIVVSEDDDDAGGDDWLLMNGCIGMEDVEVEKEDQEFELNVMTDVNERIRRQLMLMHEDDSRQGEEIYGSDVNYYYLKMIRQLLDS